MISILVPVYNDAQSLKELHARILKSLENRPEKFEIVFVNDGSRDNSWEIMKELKPLRAVCHQRNYGNTPALDTAIQHAQGEILVFLDADLQNNPADISKFIDKINSGFDVVVGWRKKRYDPWRRLVFSKVANLLVRFLLDLKIHDFGCGLRAYRARFIKDFRLWGNMQIFLPALAKERGAIIGEVEISHSPRVFRGSGMKISKMAKTVFDLFAVIFFLRYFIKPFRFFGGWGFFFTLVGFLFWFSTSLSFGSDSGILFVSGTMFVVLGIVLFAVGFLTDVLLRLYWKDGHYFYFIREEIENK
ncbi:MAG: glycosyltransferase family 2 protein [Minisyncoccia bacterium]